MNAITAFIVLHKTYAKKSTVAKKYLKKFETCFIQVIGAVHKKWELFYNLLKLGLHDFIHSDEHNQTFCSFCASSMVPEGI